MKYKKSLLIFGVIILFIIGVFYFFIRYKSENIDDIDAFFSDFSLRAKSYLIENKIINEDEIVSLECTKTYTKSYSEFAQYGKYLDLTEIPFYEGDIFTNDYRNWFKANVNKYELKDKDLLLFLSNQKNIGRKVREFTKCMFGSKTIIGYLYDDDSPLDNQVVLRLGYLINGKIKNEVTIKSNDGLFNCNKFPFVVTKGYAYFECGYGDAGYLEKDIYEMNMENGSVKKILLCSKTQELGTNQSLPKFNCTVPETEQ